MSNTAEILDDRADKASALDRFARTSEGGPRQEISLPQNAFSGAGDRIIGAQAVAVYRDEGKVLSKLKALAAAAGTDWFYRYPVQNRKENRTDWIEGPSIKLANDLARLYGNCDVDVRVMDLGDSWLFYARFSDYETGFSLTRPFQQRKNASKMGGADDGRRLDIALQIGASKAIRNVVVNALQTYSDFAFEEAKNALVDKIGSDVAKWREKVQARLAELDINPTRVDRVIGRKASEWLAPDIARIIAMMKAVVDGMATLDETFPPLEAEPHQEETKAEDGAEKPAQASLDDFAAAKDETAPAASAAEPDLHAAVRERGRADAAKGIKRMAPTKLSNEEREAYLEAFDEARG